jgi:hypothetical protein
LQYSLYLRSTWICSMPTPMQCAPVEQAEEIEKDGPCSSAARVTTASPSRDRELLLEIENYF